MCWTTLGAVYQFRCRCAIAAQYLGAEHLDRDLCASPFVRVAGHLRSEPGASGLSHLGERWPASWVGAVARLETVLHPESVSQREGLSPRTLLELAAQKRR
ncbi:MAG: hypothetical protein ABR953_11620 [Candidatus Acidiferrales bacterium]